MGVNTINFCAGRFHFAKIYLFYDKTEKIMNPNLISKIEGYLTWILLTTDNTKIRQIIYSKRNTSVPGRTSDNVSLLLLIYFIYWRCKNNSSLMEKFVTSPISVFELTYLLFVDSHDIFTDGFHFMFTLSIISVLLFTVLQSQG